MKVEQTEQKSKSLTVRANKMKAIKFHAAEDDIKKEMIIKELRKNDGLMWQTATGLGIGRTDLWRYINKLNIMEELTSIEDAVTDRIEKRLVDMLDVPKPNPDLLKFYLKCRAKIKYSEGPSTMIQNNFNHNITFQFDQLPNQNIELPKIDEEMDERDNPEE